jgi:hypothetical protein
MNLVGTLMLNKKTKENAMTIAINSLSQFIEEIDKLRKTGDYY